MAEANGPEPKPFRPDELAACLNPLLAEAPSGILLAVSGGPDSIALMHLAARLSLAQVLPSLTVATVDHALRPDSRGDAAFVLAEAEKLALPGHLLTWSGPKPSRAIQEKAREARYALLTALCRQIGASHLITAHTLDDQAETLLFRIARGSGVAGLAGMSARRFRDGIVHARPLLDVPKVRLVMACEAGPWAFRLDPSNHDPRFARSRLRRLLPLLESEGLDARRLGLLARRAARAEAALTNAAERLGAEAERPAEPGTLRLDARLMQAQPEELAIRVLGRAAERIGHRPAIRLDRLERLAAEIGVAVRAGARLRRTLGGAVFSLSPEGQISVIPEGTRHRGTVVPIDPIDPDKRQNTPFPDDQSPFTWQ